MFTDLSSFILSLIAIQAKGDKKFRIAEKSRNNYLILSFVGHKNFRDKNGKCSTLRDGFFQPF